MLANQRFNVQSPEPVGCGAAVSDTGGVNMDAITELMEGTQLPEQELASILRQGALVRLPFLEGRLQSAQTEAKRFEVKYHTTLTQLRQQGLPSDANYEMHEDFIEWEYWSDLATELKETTAQIRLLLNATANGLAIA